MITSRSQLHELLRIYNLPKVVVEVGTAECRYSKEMLLNWGLERLILVDIFEQVPFIEGCASFEPSWHENNYNEALKLKEINSDVVSILKGFSHEVCKIFKDEELSMVYIDADHSYNGCKTDIACWYPKLMKGGIMALHDYANPAYGVNRAVTEFASVRGIEVHEIPEDGNIANIGAWFQKPY